MGRSRRGASPMCCCIALRESRYGGALAEAGSTPRDYTIQYAGTASGPGRPIDRFQKAFKYRKTGRLVEFMRAVEESLPGVATSAQAHLLPDASLLLLRTYIRTTWSVCLSSTFITRLYSTGGTAASMPAIPLRAMMPTSSVQTDLILRDRRYRGASVEIFPRRPAICECPSGRDGHSVA